MRTLLLIFSMCFLAGCTSVTGNTYYINNTYLTADQQSTVSGSAAVSPENKATQGVITSSQTIPSTTSLTATIPVVP